MGNILDSPIAPKYSGGCIAEEHLQKIDHLHYYTKQDIQHHLKGCQLCMELFNNFVKKEHEKTKEKVVIK